MVMDGSDVSKEKQMEEMRSDNGAIEVWLLLKSKIGIVTNGWMSERQRASGQRYSIT
jgi:hypothetical protein